MTTENWPSYATTICRLCLQKDGFMLGIFNHLQGKNKSIYKKIMDCTALQISFGDGLPNVICHRCLYKIEFCLDFRQLCFLSDATLRQYCSTNNNKNGTDGNESPQMPYYPEENGIDAAQCVMVVDPSVPDYDSEYDSEAPPGSDGETIEDEDKNISMCKYCDQAFIDKVECASHEANAHNPEVPYTCAECAMNFADRLQYSAHMKNVHQNGKPYNCPQCERTFARRSDLRKHTIVHTGIKPFSCSVCSKSFSRNTNLSKHMRIHSNSKPFACTKCPRTFFSKGDLTRHLLTHTNVKPFVCAYCPMSFGRKDKMLRHEKRHIPVQTEENMVISVDPFGHNDFNSTEATNSDDLPPPILEPAIKLEEEPPQNEILIPSIPEHITGDSVGGTSDKRPYKCKICPKRFLSAENLRYHEASHTGIRPHKCPVCTKGFIRKRELDRHYATHTGMKPFECPKCKKSFGRKDKLIRHMRIHDVNKQFSCKQCSATFSRREALQQHVKTHKKQANGASGSELPPPEFLDEIPSEMPLEIEMPQI